MGQSHPRKLTLNRETVRDLTKDVLVSIEGGKSLTAGPACYPFTIFTTAISVIPCRICCLDD